jgi:hypothetical protein
MKIKNLATMIAVALLAANAAFGQTITITGNVQTLSTAQVGLACGPDLWNIQRTSTTTVTNGTLAVGNTVTVQCASADATKIPGGAAQKKENPL